MRDHLRPVRRGKWSILQAAMFVPVAAVLLSLLGRRTTISRVTTKSASVRASEEAHRKGCYSGYYQHRGEAESKPWREHVA